MKQQNIRTWVKPQYRILLRWSGKRNSHQLLWPFTSSHGEADGNKMETDRVDDLLKKCDSVRKNKANQHIWMRKWSGITCLMLVVCSSARTESEFWHSSFNSSTVVCWLMLASRARMSTVAWKHRQLLDFAVCQYVWYQDPRPDSSCYCQEGRTGKTTTFSHILGPFLTHSGIATKTKSSAILMWVVGILLQRQTCRYSGTFGCYVPPWCIWCSPAILLHREILFCVTITHP